MNYLLKNGYFPFIDECKDVYVENGHINKIGKNLQINDTEIQVVDLEKRILINGFVDSHMHLDKALIGEEIVNKSGTLNEAIEIMSKYKKNMDKQSIKERAKKVIELAFHKGARFLRTHIDVDEKIQLSSIEALLELKEEYKDVVEIQLIAFPQDGITNNHEAYTYLEEALKAGADLIGGIPAIEDDQMKHIKMIFDLASKYDVDIDMHIDETDDPKSLTIKDLAEMTIANDYIGRVTAGHCCSLAAHYLEDILPIIDLIKEAQINIISLPSTNLYLQGREDEKNIRRGITPVKFLYDKGIPVMIGSDNIRDPFNPFGNANLLEEALIAAHGCHMGGEKDINNLFDMVSIVPGQYLGFDYNLEEGKKANFIILNTETKTEAIIKQVNVFGYFKENTFQMTNE